jgi:tRNA(Ile)-lysidine synthase
MVLLHLCAAIRDRYPHLAFHAIHVHHGLHPDADAWGSHCESAALALRIPLVIKHVNALPVAGESPEEAARNARYGAFSQHIHPGDLLLLAHHQDDQAETVLLQLLRGAGLEGISGMPSCTSYHEGFLLRPLLNVSSKQIADWASDYKIKWIDDPSNSQDRYDRNYLRHEIMPLLRRRWPATSEVISRSARHAASAAAHQKERQHNLGLLVTNPKGQLDLSACRTLSTDDRALALRSWISNQVDRMPSEKFINELWMTFGESEPDREPRLQMPDGSSLLRYRESVYRIKHLLEPKPCRWSQWPVTLQLPNNNGQFVMSGSDAPIPFPPVTLGGQLYVSYRMGGERIRLKGREGHHELKDLFQAAGIPPWIRSRMPLLYKDDLLISIGGVWTNEEATSITSLFGKLHPRWIPPEGLDPEDVIGRLWLNS